LVEVDVTNVFAKTFTTSSGNEELCNPTGLELQESPSIEDHWFEFEDSEGGLHYGR
jgi:hypothetical protein